MAHSRLTTRLTILSSMAFLVPGCVAGLTYYRMLRYHFSLLLTSEMKSTQLGRSDLPLSGVEYYSSIQAHQTLSLASRMLTNSMQVQKQMTERPRVEPTK